MQKSKFSCYSIQTYEHYSTNYTLKRTNKNKPAFETDFPLTFINNMGFNRVNSKGTGSDFGLNFLGLSVGENIVCAFDNFDDGRSIGEGDLEESDNDDRSFISALLITLFSSCMIVSPLMTLFSIFSS